MDVLICTPTHPTPPLRNATFQPSTSAAAGDAPSGTPLVAGLTAAEVTQALLGLAGTAPSVLASYDRRTQMVPSFVPPQEQPVRCVGVEVRTG